MSPSMEIAVAAAVGVGLIGLGLLLRQLRERDLPEPRQVALALPAAAFVGLWAYGNIHQGGLPRGARLTMEAIFLAACIAGLIVSLRTVATFWNDENELDELFGSSEGYIPRRRLIPKRYQALLTILLFLGVAVFLAVHLASSLGAGA